MTETVTTPYMQNPTRVLKSQSLSEVEAFAGAVLVSMIVFGGTMLIAYGVSKGLLSF